MKYILLIYGDERRWQSMSQDDMQKIYAGHRAYGEAMTKAGVMRGGSELKPVSTATSVRFTNGKPATLDGPFAETKEQLGGILILEATDLNHAIRLISKHPGLKIGPFEIRPGEDISAVVTESERRRSHAG